jgi:hypothetical protein
MESSSNFLFNNHIYNSEGVTFFIGQFLDSDHSADGHRMYTSSGKLQNDVPFFTTSGALDSSNQGPWNKIREIPMSVAHLTQRLLLVLTISNLLDPRGLALLLSPFIQCLASIILPLS